MNAKLILEDNSEFTGTSFGAPISTAGEVVFSTGMVGYPESLTDPSYLGQILILTYPLIGNYGVSDKKYWESDGIKASAVIVSDYIDTPSHFQSNQTLAQWLKDEQIPALEIKDTRFLTQKLRTNGTMLGKILIDSNKNSTKSKTNGENLVSILSSIDTRSANRFYNPNKENLVAKVSTKKLIKMGKGKKKILLLDCGAKNNTAHCLVKRGVEVTIAPWDYDPFPKQPDQVTQKHLGRWRSNDFDSSEVKQFEALVISNGPGDPKMADKTIQTIQKALKRNIPILGVCLGHQLLALAAGGDTTKLKFGHRSQNQPCIREGSNQCFITTQNHGFHVSKIPNGFRTWFTNANDGTNEGIIHTKYPVMSVQFHPEAHPGPTDTEWIFDFFLKKGFKNS